MGSVYIDFFKYWKQAFYSSFWNFKFVHYYVIFYPAVYPVFEWPQYMDRIQILKSRIFFIE